MGQWSAQSMCVVVISNLLSSSLPTSNVIKPRIQFNLKNVSWVCHCFCGQSVTALIQPIIFPSKFCNNFSTWAHRFSDSQNLVSGWEVSLSHLLEIEKNPRTHPRPEETAGLELSNLYFERALQEILMKAEFELISFLLANGSLCKKPNCIIPPVHRPTGYLED